MVSFSSGTLTNVVNDGTLMGFNEEKGTKGHSTMDTLAVPAFKGLLEVINLVQGFAPGIDALSTAASSSAPGRSDRRSCRLSGCWAACWRLPGFSFSAGVNSPPRKARNRAMPPKLYKWLLSAVAVALLARGFDHPKRAHKGAGGPGA